jgi:hypothetical protein
MFNIPKKTKVTIIDQPCGTGKTSNMLNSFETDKKYLVVLPYISEINRLISHTKGTATPFVEPSTDSYEHDTKSSSLKELLINGQNIATTHALYTSAAILANEGLLKDYHVIIDEVPTVIEDAARTSPASYDEVLLDGGFLQESSEGLLTPTSKWIDRVEDITMLPRVIFNDAKSGRLYRVDGKFFLKVLPTSLFIRTASTTILTYLASDSYLSAYFNKMGIDYEIERDEAADAAFRQKAKELITVKSIQVFEGIPLSYSKQTKLTEKQTSSGATALKNLKQRELKGINDESILITCAMSNWYCDANKSKFKGFGKGSRLTNAKWLPNTTRGTNAFIDTHTLIYLYDQHTHPAISKFLGVSSKANEYYAVSELIQWIYRSRVRRSEPITLYLPSERMRKLLEKWMNNEI